MTKHGLRALSFVAWLALVAAIGLVVGRWYGDRGADHGAPAVRSILLYPTPRALPPFTLRQPDGQALTAEALKGNWVMVFFGFTHCPDVCPNTLAILKQVEARAAQAVHAPPFKTLFVSVDPERDGGQALAEYVRYFSPRMLAATGEATELQKVARATGTVYAKVAGGDGAYTIDHSAHIVLLDPDGRMRGVFRPPLDAEAIWADLNSLAESHP